MKKYILLSIVIVLVNFGQSFLMPTGGVYADSLSYFEIAADLPNQVTALFPIGYPVALRTFQIIFGDYFWAYKFLNVAMMVCILIFSYRKQFFFKETVLLMMAKTFLFVFSIAISESLFLFLLYFLIFFFYEIFNSDKDNVSAAAAAAASLILVLMFFVRYSAIYIYMAVLAFTVLLFINRNSRMYVKPFIILLSISGVGIVSYLFFNYKTFGSFTGEDLRGLPSDITPTTIVRNILGVMNVVNPYIGIKPSSNSLLSFFVQFLVLVVDIAILIFGLRYFRSSKGAKDFNFHQLLWTITTVYAIGLLVSGWTQQIEEMNTRMMAAANVCLFFSFLILYLRSVPSDKIIWRISCFFFVFTTLYTLKSPTNYFKNREQIEPQMAKFKDKKYIYNNERGAVELTTYNIPVINKSFQYAHTNGRSGDTKHSIAGTLNPKMKWLLNDTVTDKSQILLTSEIVLKKR